MAQAAEQRHSVPTFQVRFHLALGFYLSLSVYDWGILSSTCSQTALLYAQQMIIPTTLWRGLKRRDDVSLLIRTHVSFELQQDPGPFEGCPLYWRAMQLNFQKNWLSCAAWSCASLICTEWAKKLRKYNSQNIWFQPKLTARLFIPAALQAATKTSCCRIHLPPRGPKILVLAEKSWVRGPHRHSDDQNEPDQTFHVYESQVSDEMSTWVIKISRFWLSSVSSCYRIRRKYLAQAFNSVESLQTSR